MSTAAVVKDHAWFTKAQFPWKRLETRKLVAPGLPITGIEDVKNSELYDDWDPDYATNKQQLMLGDMFGRE